MIPTHSLPGDAFIALATGAGDSRVIRYLREAQHSKHLMLLHAMAKTAAGAEPPSPAIAAFRAQPDAGEVPVAAQNVRVGRKTLCQRFAAHRVLIFGVPRS